MTDSQSGIFADFFPRARQSCLGVSGKYSAKGAKRMLQCGISSIPM
ncbi:hypothetical protein [Ensifer adhaerens]|nr:hypothetical protein [Ensifer adhaerens]